jgi:hypothetical protein
MRRADWDEISRKEETMKDKAGSAASPEIPSAASIRVGFYAAIITAIITVVTFSFAITAIPISGAYCLEGCIDYPYLDTLAQFPMDYLWMYLAIILVLSFLVLMASIHASAAQPRKIFSQIALALAGIASTVLLLDFFVQVSVVPISLINGETEGIPLLTQYNPHGLFIALEELGYLVMALSFLFVAPVFAGRSRLESAVRWIFIIGFVLAIVALAAISITFGLDRQYRLELAIISIDWLVLIVNGFLLGIVFRRQLRDEGNP